MCVLESIFQREFRDIVEEVERGRIGQCSSWSNLLPRDYLLDCHFHLLRVDGVLDTDRQTDRGD
jgi:hypothetical protein